MKNRTVHPVQTNDGSYTLLFEELNEHYHSKDGALGESSHVYIKNGLERVRDQKDPIRVLEIGVGTGLNVILSFEWAENNKKKLEYIGIEPYPLDIETHRFLKENTPLFKKHKDAYDNILNEGSLTSWSDYFRYEFSEETIESFQSSNYLSHFDVIYFDAFAPSKQEEMWEPEILKKCSEMLKDGAVLTTYCASGKFKRSLKSAGFEIIREKGFALKREMFVGIKKPGHDVPV